MKRIKTPKPKVRKVKRDKNDNINRQLMEELKRRSNLFSTKEKKLMLDQLHSYLEVSAAINHVTYGFITILNDSLKSKGKKS